MNQRNDISGERRPRTAARAERARPCQAPRRRTYRPGQARYRRPIARDMIAAAPLPAARCAGRLEHLDHAGRRGPRMRTLCHRYGPGARQGDPSPALPVRCPVRRPAGRPAPRWQQPARHRPAGLAAALPGRWHRLRRPGGLGRGPGPVSAAAPAAGELDGARILSQPATASTRQITARAAAATTRVLAGSGQPSGRRSAIRGAPGRRRVLEHDPDLSVPRRGRRGHWQLPSLALLRHPPSPARGPWQFQSSCSTHPTATRIRRAIVSQSVRRSANRACPPRRSDDGQAILEHTR
jgi:hypothetical protein